MLVLLPFLCPHLALPAPLVFAEVGVGHHADRHQREQRHAQPRRRTGAAAACAPPCRRDNEGAGGGRRRRVRHGHLQLRRGSNRQDVADVDGGTAAATTGAVQELNDGGWEVCEVRKLLPLSLLCLFFLLFLAIEVKLMGKVTHKTKGCRC